MWVCGFCVFLFNNVNPIYHLPASSRAMRFICWQSADVSDRRSLTCSHTESISRRPWAQASNCSPLGLDKGAKPLRRTTMMGRCKPESLPLFVSVLFHSSKVTKFPSFFKIKRERISMFLDNKLIFSCVQRETTEYNFAAGN